MADSAASPSPSIQRSRARSQWTDTRSPNPPNRLVVVATACDEGAQRRADANLEPVRHLLGQQAGQDLLRTVEVHAHAQLELRIGEPQLALLGGRHRRARLEVLGIDAEPTR